MPGHVGQAEVATAASAASAAQSETGLRDKDNHSGQQRPGTAAASGQELTPAETLLARALAKARYHEDREAFLGAATRWLNFLVLVFGTGAFAGLIAAGDHPAAKWAAAGTALIGSIQLVFDFPGLARTHIALRRLATEICADAVMPDADIAALNYRLIRLSAEEPPTFHAVEALAYNHAQNALGRSAKTLLQVRWWDQLWKNFWRFKGGYKSADEIAAGTKPKN